MTQVEHKEYKEYMGTSRELLLRALELQATKIELMVDWQDYNRKNNNELSWDKYFK